jgi:hypothetical protein
MENLISLYLIKIKHNNINMNIYVHLFYCLIIGVTLPSCEKDAQVKLPTIEPKLVVSSFISPQDSLIQVAVSLSSPLYNNPNISNKYEPLLNATVTINNATNSYNLNYDSILERYVIDSFQLKIIGGTSYYLKVKAPNGKFAEAKTTIPLLNNTLTYTVANNTSWNYSYFLEGCWIDNDVNNKNNYRFEVAYTSYFVTEGYTNNGNFSDTTKTWQSDKIIKNDTEENIFKEKLNFNYSIYRHDTVFALLSTISKEYIDYINKIDLTANSFSSPFSEPVQMYTNVKGGFGIFASYNQYKLRVFP